MKRLLAALAVSAALSSCAASTPPLRAPNLAALSGKSPGDVYADYQSALFKAVTIDDVTAYLTKARRAELGQMSERARQSALEMMKSSALESLHVGATDLHGDEAIVSVGGMQTSLVNGAKAEARGTVRLVMEDGVWEVDAETITIGDEGPHAIPDGPQPTVAPEAPLPAS